MSGPNAGTPEATVDWVVVCESIGRDNATGRLSLIGLASHLPVPSLPLLLNEHRVVARLAHLQAGQSVDVSFGIVTPAGLWITPAADDAAELEMVGEFVVITLRSLPLREEGIHRFEVSLANGSAASVEVAVWLCSPRQEHPHVH